MMASRPVVWPFVLDGKYAGDLVSESSRRNAFLPHVQGGYLLEDSSQARPTFSGFGHFYNLDFDLTQGSQVLSA